MPVHDDQNLILHIGLQKTGTSSIQVMLNSSATYLREAGYIFPVLPPRSEMVWNSAFRHNIVAATYADFRTAFSKMTDAEQEGFWVGLAADALTPVLSAEDFSRQKDFTRLGTLLRPYRVTVIAYLRRQDQFAESLYNQRNKILVERADDRLLSPDLLTENGLYEFLRVERYAALLDYGDLLRRIEEQIRPIRLVVRVFDRTKLAGGDVCVDFAEQLGLDAGRMTLPKAPANELIPNNWLQKLLDVLATAGPGAARVALADISHEFRNGRIPKGSYAIFSPRSREQFLRQYEVTNHRIGERFGLAFD